MSHCFNPFYIRSWVRTRGLLDWILSGTLCFNPFYIRSWVRTVQKKQFRSGQAHHYCFNPFYIRSWVRTAYAVWGGGY